MADKQVLRSKVLNETTRLLTLYEEKKGSKELNPLLALLRDFKQDLLKKKGVFVSPKVEKKISDLRSQLAKIPD